MQHGQGRGSLRTKGKQRYTRAQEKEYSSSDSSETNNEEFMQPESSSDQPEADSSDDENVSSELFR